MWAPPKIAITVKLHTFPLKIHTIHRVWREWDEGGNDVGDSFHHMRGKGPEIVPIDNNTVRFLKTDEEFSIGEC